jgi:DNA modification methylase
MEGKVIRLIMFRNKYLIGDSLEILRTLPDESVQCVVTSPPYWALRDYGVDGQYGLEPTPEEHIARMVEVFREVRRVLRKDGTFWLNYGDSYAVNNAAGNKVFGNPEFNKNRPGRQLTKTANKKISKGFKPKDLLMIPARLALALQADGWWLRSEIIWFKPNPMPESVTDRPTNAHEKVYLLTKSPRYFYDVEAVRERANYDGRKDIVMKGSAKYANEYNPIQSHQSIAIRGHERWLPLEDGTPGRNLRNVWEIPNEPFPDPHFATFPRKLAKICILAGTSPKACPKCEAPWARVVEKGNLVPDEPHYKPRGTTKPQPNVKTAMTPAGTAKGHLNFHYEKKDHGFRPTCNCKGNDGSGRCIVLDPFMGSGRVAAVAQELGRDWIGIDLNPDYRRMAEKYITTTIGLGI